MVDKKPENKEAKKVQLTPELANNLFGSEKQRYESIIKEKQRLEHAYLSLERTMFALEEISKSQDDEIMVNLGSGVYVPSKVKSKTEVKYMVGSEVFLNKSIDEVLKSLKTKKEKILKDVDSLKKMESLSQENLNNLYKYLMQVQKNSK